MNYAEYAYSASHLPSYPIAHQIAPLLIIKSEKLSPITSAGSTLVLLIPESVYNSASVSYKPYSKELDRVFKELKWAEKFFQTASQLNDSKSLLPFYREINTLVADKNFNLCNLFISQLNPKDLSDTLLVGILRLTSNWRPQLSFWPALLEQTKIELNNRNYNAEVLLKGLI